MFITEIGLGGFMRLTPLTYNAHGQQVPIRHHSGSTIIEFGVGVIRITVFGDVVERIRMDKPQNETTMNELLALYHKLVDWMDVRDPNGLYPRPAGVTRPRRTFSFAQ